MRTREKLSILWIVVMLNILIADVLSVFIELKEGNTLEIFGDVTFTMAIAAILLNIPVLMIYFTKSLILKVSRNLNIIASILTLIFVIGGGSLRPHYIICATIETGALLAILFIAWGWKDTRNRYA